MDRDFVILCTQDGYHHRGHSKTKLLVHLVFVTKYRKPILTGSFGIDVKQMLFESAKRHHWYIQAMETDKDHIHILLQYPPGDSIWHIVSILKQGKHLSYLADTSSQNTCPALLGRTYIMVGWVLCGQHWRCFGRNNPSVYRQPGVIKNAPKGATFPYEIDERRMGQNRRD